MFHFQDLGNKSLTILKVLALSFHTLVHNAGNCTPGDTDGLSYGTKVYMKLRNEISSTKKFMSLLFLTVRNRTPLLFVKVHL